MKRGITIVDVAKECGLSITTVSRVINHIPDVCKPETEKKVWDAIDKLNYKPNTIARSLVKRRTGMIAVLVPDVRNDFFQQLYEGIELYCAENDYKVILCNTNASDIKEAAYIEDLCSGTVDGLLVTTLNGNEDNSKLRELHEKGFPLVLIERYGAGVEDIYRTYFDNLSGMKEAVSRLCDLGHRRIAYISGPVDAKNAQVRLCAYHEAMAEAGIDVDENLIRYGEYKFATGVEAMKDLLKKETFTAVVAANDLIAIGVYSAAKDAGLRIPDDLSVVGFDGTLLAELQQPPLDTVELQGAKMGMRAAEILISLIRGELPHEKQVIFVPHIRVGGSSKQLK